MEKLKELDYDPGDPGSYGGVEKLYRSGKKARMRNLTRTQVRKFLAEQQS